MASRRLWLYWALYVGLALFIAPTAADYYPPSKSSANLTSEHSSHAHTTPPSHSGYPLPVSDGSHHSGYPHPTGHSSYNHSHPASHYSRPHPTPHSDDCSTSLSAHQPYSSHSAENSQSHSRPRHSGYYPIAASHSEHSLPDHTGTHSHHHHHHHSNHSTHEPTKCITVTSRSRWGSDSLTHYPETGRSHSHSHSVKTLTQPCGCPFPAPTVYEKEDHYGNAHGKEVTIVNSASSCLSCPVVTKSRYPDCPLPTTAFCAFPNCVILKPITVPCGCSLSTTTKCDGMCHPECSTLFSAVPLCPFTGIGSGGPLGASSVPMLATAYGG